MQTCAQKKQKREIGSKELSKKERVIGKKKLRVLSGGEEDKKKKKEERGKLKKGIREFEERENELWSSSWGKKQSE